MSSPHPTTWTGVLLNAMAIICPLVMALLSQKPGTRFWRTKIYPIGVVSAVLAILHLREQTRRTFSPGGRLFMSRYKLISRCDQLTPSGLRKYYCMTSNEPTLADDSSRITSLLLDHTLSRMKSIYLTQSQMYDGRSFDPVEHSGSSMYSYLSHENSITRPIRLLLRENMDFCTPSSGLVFTVSWSTCSLYQSVT